MLLLICMGKSKQLLNFLQHFIYLTEWFQQQSKFTTDFETMEVNKMNSFPAHFHEATLSVL